MTQSVIDAPVADRTDSERSGHDTGSRNLGSDCQAEHDVGAAGDGALGEGDVRGADLTQAGGHAIVQAPTETGADNEERSQPQVGCIGPHQHHSGGNHRNCTGDHTPTQVLPEHEGSQQGGGDEFEIEEQRGGGSRGCGTGPR